MIVKNLKCNTDKIKNYVPVSYDNTKVGDKVYRIHSSYQSLWKVKYIDRKLIGVIVENDKGDQGYYPGLSGLYKIKFSEIEQK